MTERSNNVRKYILDQLEEGVLHAGDKIPSARHLAKMFNMSLPQVQIVLTSFMQDGILETRARHGSYVQSNWRERVPSASFFSFSQKHSYREISALLENKIPNLYISKTISRATFEVKVSHQLLRTHNEYMDLKPLFTELFGNGEEFFSHLLEPFVVDGKLCGIPLVFSPRLLIFNQKLLEKYNAPIPQEDWTWEDFIDLVKYLRQYISGEQIFYWGNHIYQWINIVTRFNGMLFSDSQEDSVQIDSANTISGLLAYVKLRENLQINRTNFPNNIDYFSAFARGEIAMTISDFTFLDKLHEQKRDLKDFNAVAIPTPEGGVRKSIMAAELLCIRNTCSDMEMARDVIKTLLSSEVQEIFVQNNHSIPFRKRIVWDEFQHNSHLSKRFTEEISTLCSTYNIYSSELYNMICNGISDILLLPSSKVTEATQQLATAVRIFFKYSKENEERRSLAFHPSSIQYYAK